MLKKCILLLLLSLSLFAREEMKALQNCEAFNNMKHSQNSHHVFLHPNKNYTVINHHKGQYLILLPGEQPAQRWVNEGCFSNTKKLENSLDEYIEKSTKQSSNSKNYDKTEVSQNNLLALSWHNAFCETHRNKKECRRNVFMLYKSGYRETHFILHGFWPQPAGKAYCGVEQKYITMDKYKHWNKLPKIPLRKETKERLTEIMPGVHSNLHKHEWYRHGTCYGTDAEHYFKKAIALVEQFHHSEVSSFFEKHIGKRVNIKQIQNAFDQDFGAGAGKSVELRCRQGLVTELWLHLGGGSDTLGTLLKNGKKVRSRCQYGILDKAGYGR